MIRRAARGGLVNLCRCFEGRTELGGIAQGCAHIRNCNPGVLWAFGSCMIGQMLLGDDQQADKQQTHVRGEACLAELSKRIAIL